MQVFLLVFLLACGPKRPPVLHPPPAVDLPDAEADTLATPPFLVVVLTREGTVSVDGAMGLGVLPDPEDPNSPRWLVDALRIAHQTSPSAKLVIVCDKLADFRALRGLVFAANAVGFVDLFFATAAAAGDPPESYRGLLVHQTPMDPDDLRSRSPPIILSSLDKSKIDAVIRRDMNGIRRCYQRALSRHPALSGKITVKFTISAGGLVSKPIIKRNDMNLQDAGLETCLVERFQKMIFPSPNGGGSVIVSYPFIFAPS